MKKILKQMKKETKSKTENKTSNLEKPQDTKAAVEPEKIYNLDFTESELNRLFGLLSSLPFNQVQPALSDLQLKVHRIISKELGQAPLEVVK